MSDGLKERTERGVAESFLQAWNSANGSTYAILDRSDAPDFICKDDRTGEVPGLEIATIYYDDEAAEKLWNQLRGRTSQALGLKVNPELGLVANLKRTIVEKCRRDYGSGCALALHMDAPLTTVQEFENGVLPLLQVPQAIPFDSICIRLGQKNAQPAIVWWEIYPRRQRLHGRSLV